MKVEYIRSLDLPGRGEWPKGTEGDPLHPSHGPLPTVYGALRCQGEDFLVALWDGPDNHLHIMLELAKSDPEDEDIPMLDIDECHHMRGWIAQFYTWKQEGACLACRGRKISLPEHYEPEDEWISECYRHVMRESVKIAATDPIRAPKFYNVAKRIEESAKR